MKTDQFIRLALTRGKQFVNYINGWTFQEYRRLAALTEFYDYGCDFSDDGLCFRYRRPDMPKPDDGICKCCCHSCYGSTGYLYKFPNEYEQIKIYAHFYKHHSNHWKDPENLGFWREGKGCILPRELRSPTCLTHMCRVNQYVPLSMSVLFSCLKERPKELNIAGFKRLSFDAFYWRLRELILKETSKKG